MCPKRAYAGHDDGGESWARWRREGREEKAVSFGERLRAQKDREEEEASDEEKRLNLTEQEGAFASLFPHVRAYAVADGWRVVWQS